MSNIVLQQPCNWRCLHVNMQRMYKATCGISGNTMHEAVKTKHKIIIHDVLMPGILPEKQRDVTKILFSYPGPCPEDNFNFI